MTRRDWWLGVGIVASALLLHAALPRYEWRSPGGNAADYLRLDRWTGHALWGTFVSTPGPLFGQWLPVSEVRAIAETAASLRRTKEQAATVDKARTTLKELDAMFADGDTSTATVKP